MSTVPALRFGALFDKSWAGVQNNLPLIAALTLIYGMATAVLYRIPFFGHFISGMISPGYLICLMKLRNKENISIQDFFWAFMDFNRFLHLIVLSAATGLIIIAGFIVFIIPGIYLSVALWFASTYFVLRKQDAIAAIKSSYHLVHGRWWDYGILFFMIAILNLAGAICFFVGLLVTIPMTVLIMVQTIDEMDPVKPTISVEVPIAHAETSSSDPSQSQ